MAERYPEAELVLDDELLYDDAPRRSTFLRRGDERPEDIVREGEVLAGKYRVERIPGRNGLGVLVQVRHLELGQEVTLKFLVPEACAYPEFVQRFVREARAAVKIPGEHVARVTDVGRLESGAPYMVREYLRGPDLAEVLKVRGPLPVEEAVDYIIQACEGVAEGHALGVVHRNLRPTSLVVARRSDGTALVKVFDFAAAESLHVNPFTERAVSLVGTSAIMASLPYLAPEQIRDPHDVDFRADIYSLGAVLYELLTGTPVYAADAAPALLAQVAADPAPSLRNLRPEAPGELDHIVLRCLAKNRAIRYGSLAELVLALKQFASPELAPSIERIVRLGKRTSKLPEVSSESRIPSLLPLAPVPSIPPSQPRGRHGTVLLHTAEAPVAQVARPSVHDDVTTINPYASYGAPVVIHPDSHSESSRLEALRDMGRTEPLPRVEPAPPMRTEPLPPRSELQRVETPRVEPSRRTPTPPPIRMSAPSPLHDSAAPVAAAAAAAPATATPAPSAPPPLTQRPEGAVTSLPPRSSMSGLSRSWAVPGEAPSAPLFTQRRLVTLSGLAAGAALALVLALRQHPAPAVAAAPPAPAKVELPPPALAKVEPPPAPPAPLEVPAPVANAVASANTATPVVPAAAPKPVVAKARRAAPTPAPRRAAAEAAPEPPKTVAAVETVASSRPAGGDMFDDPR
ncbi:MAG TPA: serine/threonine-protein kinase [Polyangiaceae bacterium]|nr:serine/threonine-protein kinase [Polyangiaceae bacterium]